MTIRVDAESDGPSFDDPAFACAALDALPGAWAAVDAAGRLLRVGARWRAAIAAAPSSGAPWFTAVDASGRAAAGDAWRRCVNGEAPCEFDARLHGPDGALHWWRLRAHAMPAPGGGWLLLATDVDELKRADVALRESEARFRQLADGINQFAWILDAAGNVQWVNRRWSDFFGHSMDDVADWVWHDLIHPAHRERVTRQVGESLATGQPYEDTFLALGAQRGERWLLTHLMPIRDLGGAVVSWFGTATDVTAQREVEDAMRRREQELRAITDNSPDIVSRFDRALRHVYVNAAVERATGRPREHFLGRTNRELGMPPELCDGWDAALLEVFETGERRQFEFSFAAPDGARHYDAKLVPERDADGRIAYVLGVTHDRTVERQASLALEASNRRKDEFLATLAHELRNPLAPIRNGLAVLQQQALPGPATDLLGMMDRQLDHVVHLIDDLLDISRINSGKIVLKRERVVLRPIVERAIEATLPFMDASQHVLTVDMPDAPIVLDADPTRLAQVLSNLLANAAKYTPELGRIELRVREEGAMVAISVTDTGIGIPPDRLGEVFEMFTQIDASLHRAQGGLGIGLALVRRLVEKHGGHVEAHSAGLGRGSSFVIRLPLADLAAPDQPAASAPQPAAGESPAPGAAPRRLLVVDDNADAAESLAMFLGLLGHEVRTAGHGEGALATLDGGYRADVAIIDIGLPDLDGYEVARRWRARDGGDATVLVALTGWGANADKQRAEDAGFDHHLTKPIDPGLIEALLQRLDDTALQAAGASR